MTKKTKRSVSTARPKVETAPRVSTAAASRTSNGEFNPDYSYVMRDLKRIGVLAGSFFVVLIVLAILLN